MLVNAHFYKAFGYNNYRLWKLSEEYNGSILGKIVEWTKRMNVQMISAVMQQFDTI